MSLLDDQDHISASDPDNFLSIVEAFPGQVIAAWEAGKKVVVDPVRPIEGLAVVGMGGSGISGDVLKAILGPRFPKKVEICKGYELPGWIGPDTLVFAVSYSGGTEETLESFDRARAAEAQIVAVTTGGTLGKLAETYDLPSVAVEGGLQPRAALGHLTFGMLAVMQNLGFGDFEGDIDETMSLLDRRLAEWGRSVPTAENPAKALAEQLVGTTPVIYAAAGLGGIAAYRWKCQFNECSKVNAYWNEFSELNHNEVVGWTDPPDPACRTSMIVLRHAGEHRRISDRIDVTMSLIGDRPAVLRMVEAQGSSPTARLMDLIYLGDFVATYLALARGVDPTAIEMIDRIKRELS